MDRIRGNRDAVEIVRIMLGPRSITDEKLKHTLSMHDVFVRNLSDVLFFIKILGKIYFFLEGRTRIGGVVVHWQC